MEFELEKQFKALGHPLRLEIFEILLNRGFGYCDEFVRKYSLAQGTISKHLQIIREAGLIRWERVGNHVIYRPKIQELEKFKSRTVLLGTSLTPSKKSDTV